MDSYEIYELDEQNKKIEKLTEKLKCKETELCEIRKQLNEYKKECNRLNEINKVWEKDLKSLNMQCADLKSSLAREVEKLTLERESLCHELQIKSKQLHDMEARYDEEKCNANAQKCKYNNLFSTLVEVNKMSGQNHYGLKNKVLELQKDICSKNDDICNLKKKIKELLRENEIKCTEINSQKNTLYEKECRLTQMLLLSDKIMKIKQKCDACCCISPSPCIKPKCCIDLCCPKDPCCPEKKTSVVPIICTKPNCSPKDPCCPDKKTCALPIVCTKPNCCPKNPCCTKNPCCPMKKIGKPCLLPLSCPKPKCCSKYPCCPKEPSCPVKPIKKPCVLPITCSKPKFCPTDSCATKDACNPKKKPCALPIVCTKPKCCSEDPCATKDICCPEKIICTVPIVCTKPKCCPENPCATKNPCCFQLKPPLKKCTIITDVNNNVVENTKLNNLYCELEDVKRVVGQTLKNK